MSQASTWVSMSHSLGSIGLSGRSVKRDITISWLCGLPSLRKKDPLHYYAKDCSAALSWGEALSRAQENQNNLVLPAALNRSVYVTENGANPF